MNLFTYKPTPTRRRRPIISDTLNEIRKHKTLDNEYKTRVPWLAQKFLNSSSFSDETKLAVLKRVEPKTAETLQKYINTSNLVLDTRDNLNDFHRNLTEKVPGSKPAYREFKKYSYSGKSKKNKNKRTKNQRNKPKQLSKTLRKKNKQNKYTRYEKTKN